jgi:hypothetical protein
MMDIEIILYYIFQILFAIGIFAILAYVARYIKNKLHSSSRFKDSKFLNPLEYFPSEQVMLLKQVSYLIAILIFIIIILYLFFDWNEEIFFISILDIIISIYLAINVTKKSFKDYVILFSVIPLGSIVRLAFGDSLIILLDIFHILGYLYFIKDYYRKFLDYTDNYGLGIAIMLLFSIIAVSFLFTIVVEDVHPIDSITMVSNAFTSNSYEASGKTIGGKLTSLLLAWGGFILSSVGTATLAVSVINGYVDRQFDDMEKLIKEKKKKD